MSDTPYQANRMLAVASRMFSWAETVGLVPEGHGNPARKVGRYREHGRERYLTGEEMGRLGDALREAETVGLPYSINEAKPTARYAPKVENRRVKIDPFAVAAIRLLALTGARLREVLNARWDQLDLGRGALFIADSKTGRKPLYLSAAAKVVLGALPRLESNPYIIPGTKDGEPRADLKSPWAAATRAAGLDGLRIHDLRHSFGSIGAGASLGLSIVGKLLGHSQPATTARYSHLADDPLRRAIETIGATIDGAMNRKAGGNVVKMK
jgi:integrase